MRQNPALDIAVFQTFDAVHACVSILLPPVIELSFPGALECARAIWAGGCVCPVLDIAVECKSIKSCYGMTCREPR
jgi:hypothetical protein